MKKVLVLGDRVFRSEGEFERWAELAQSSYDRQKAELDAIRERMEK